MKVLDITINGETYPCSLTMGAMLRFKEITGHEVHQFDNSTMDLCAFVWALVMSSAKRAGKAFDMSFWDFCDNVDPNEITQCWEGFQKEQNAIAETTDGEKKSQ